MKVEVQKYKKSINESAFGIDEVAIIWEFYVTKSIAASAGQRRTPSDYGHRQLPWKQMLDIADIQENNCKILMANSINKTLQNYDLEPFEGTGKNKTNKPIEIDVPKIVCSTPYTIADEEKPKAKAGDAESVLTHIRNAFAHGNTYFFDGETLMLEDKDQRGIITARMILKKKTLLDWIQVIDNGCIFYNLKNDNSEEE